MDHFQSMPKLSWILDISEKTDHFSGPEIQQKLFGILTWISTFCSKPPKRVNHNPWARLARHPEIGGI